MLEKGSAVREGEQVGGSLQSGMGKADLIRGEDVEPQEETVHVA